MLTPSGYIRYKRGGKMVLEHKYLWEKEYGKLDDGLEIHHINGDKTDNTLSNLLAVTRVQHRRIHEGWVKKNDIWYKPCTRCNALLEVNKDNYYFTTNKSKVLPAGRLLYGKCKPCNREVTNARKAENAKKRAFA